MKSTYLNTKSSLLRQLACIFIIALVLSLLVGFYVKKNFVPEYAAFSSLEIISSSNEKVKDYNVDDSVAALVSSYADIMTSTEVLDSVRLDPRFSHLTQEQIISMLYIGNNELGQSIYVNVSGDKNIVAPLLNKLMQSTVEQGRLIYGEDQFEISHLPESAKIVNDKIWLRSGFSTLFVSLFFMSVLVYFENFIMV